MTFERPPNERTFKQVLDAFEEHCNPKKLDTAGRLVDNSDQNHIWKHNYITYFIYLEGLLASETLVLFKKLQLDPELDPSERGLPRTHSRTTSVDSVPRVVYVTKTRFTDWSIRKTSVIEVLCRNRFLHYSINIEKIQFKNTLQRPAVVI
jgi:hypothetical protein